MARVSKHPLGAVLEAAATWRGRCLVEDGSVFTERNLWTSESLKGLRTHFIDSPMEGTSETFYEKLKLQLAASGPEVKQLAAELLWVMFLFPSNVKHATKRSAVLQVWDWAGQAGIEGHPMLEAPLAEGVGSGGQGFNNYRWKELSLFITAAERFKALPRDRRIELLADPWAFGNWFDETATADKRQLRHMVLFLLFPDYFETTSSGDQKQQLLTALSPLAPDAVSKAQVAPEDSAWIKRDKQLYAIRQALQADQPTPINYYYSPWKEKWQSSKDTDLDDEPKDKSPGTARRYWVEKSLVKGRPDRESGPHAVGKALWSPTRSTDGADIYANMREAKPGDVVFHLTDNEAITGISIVAGSLEENFQGLPHTNWAGVLCYRIGLSEFVELSPSLHRSAFFAEKFRERLREGLKAHHKLFYNSSLELNQGAYLTEAPAYLVSIFREAYADLAHSALPHVAAAPGEVSGEASPAVAPFGIEDALKGLFISRESLVELLELFKSKKNLILQGPPGCGKSFVALRLAFLLLGAKDRMRVETVQFHQSYSYEDFVQGFRPTEGGGFKLIDGVFYRFCQRAAKDPGRPYVFVVDEINRGNLSKIFGEAMLLIEADKRSPDWAVSLAYSDGKAAKFYVPDNVFLLGMMNTADRSLAMVDYALRRRFAFFSIDPAFETQGFSEHLLANGVPKEMVAHIRTRFAALNDKIGADTDLGAGFRIGHSYLCPAAPLQGQHASWYKRVVDREVAPLLREYWFDKKEAVVAEAIAGLSFV